MKECELGGTCSTKRRHENTYKVSVRKSNATLSATLAAVWQYEVLLVVYVVTLICRSEGRIIIQILKSI